MQMNVGPGSLSGALGILGTALAVLFPEQRWIGGLLVLVAVVVFVFDVRIEGWHIEVSQLESTKILPQLLMGLGALGFIAGAVWYFNVPKTQPTAGAPITDMERSRRNITLMMIREKYIKEHTSAPPELLAGVENPPPEWGNQELRERGETWQVPLSIKRSLDPGIFVQCQFVRSPLKLGGDGRLYALNVFPTPLENRGGGMAEYSGQPGDDLKISDNPGFQIHKCTITNYGQKPMLSIAIGLYLVFQEAIKDKDSPNSVRNGRITAERPWLINIPKIDPGANNSFIFYIWNMTDAWASVSFPDVAEAEYIGDPERFKFRLSSANALPLTFPPKPDEPKEANAPNAPK